MLKFVWKLCTNFLLKKCKGSTSMNISKKIRIQGKQLLDNNWTSSLVVLFIMICIPLLLFSLTCVLYYIISLLNITDIISVTVITSITMLVAISLSPAFNGYLKFHYQLSETKNANINNIFYFFKKKNYFKTIRFNLYMSLCIMLRTLVVVIPLVVLMMIVYTLGEKIQLLIFPILIIIGVITAVALNLKFILTAFLFVDNPDDKLIYYHSATNKIKSRHYSDILRLFCNFIPWIALCFFVIPGLYVIPYATSSFATSAKWLIKIYKDGKM